MRPLDYLLFGLMALGLRSAAAIIVSDPPYLDPAYYELVARRLAGGDGFTTTALWSFLETGGRLSQNPQLPLPSNGHWMPLTSVVSAGSLLLFGGSRLAAELPMIVAGAALVPLTMLVGWGLWGSRRVAMVSGVLALFAGPMLVLVPTVDSFALFGVGGFAAIYGAMRVLRSDDGGAWLALAGVGVGVATLTRIDGVLLALAPATAWLIRRRVGPWSVDRPALGWNVAIRAAMVGLLIVAPWLIRQTMVFATPFPSAGGHTLWITTYNEQFSIGRPVSLETYLQAGALPIIGAKLESWGLLLGRTAVLLGGTFIFPFLYGLWRERRRAELAPFVVYWLSLFILMGGLFTLHAPSGAWYHSAWAWLPFAVPLAVGSFQPGVEAVGRRLRLLARPRNQAFVFNAAVIGALVLSLVGSASLLIDWDRASARTSAAADFLRSRADTSDVVMYVNPPALTLRSGLRSIAPPFDPYPVVEAVVRAYDVRWVVVDAPSGVGSDPLAMWGGGRSTDADGNPAKFLADEPEFSSQLVRVYAVREPPTLGEREMEE